MELSDPFATGHPQPRFRRFLPQFIQGVICDSPVPETSAPFRRIRAAAGRHSWMVATVTGCTPQKFSIVALSVDHLRNEHGVTRKISRWEVEGRILKRLIVLQRNGHDGPIAQLVSTRQANRGLRRSHRGDIDRAMRRALANETNGKPERQQPDDTGKNPPVCAPMRFAIPLRPPADSSGVGGQARCQLRHQMSEFVLNRLARL